MKDQTPTPVRGHIAFRGDQIVATYIEDDIEDFNEFNPVIAAAQ